MSKTHGQSNTLLYKVWQEMKNRCNNPRSQHFKWYGARGITVCDRWLLSFPDFASDMGPRPDGGQIDRIDNSKGYSPDNCRWASRHEQASNKRNNLLIEFCGKVQTASQWSRELGIHHYTISRRARRGVPIDGVPA